MAEAGGPYHTDASTLRKPRRASAALMPSRYSSASRTTRTCSSAASPPGHVVASAARRRTNVGLLPSATSRALVSACSASLDPSSGTSTLSIFITCLLSVRPLRDPGATGLARAEAQENSGVRGLRDGRLLGHRRPSGTCVPRRQTVSVRGLARRRATG